jgi:hypothetical protein
MGLPLLFWAHLEVVAAMPSRATLHCWRWPPPPLKAEDGPLETARCRSGKARLLAVAAPIVVVVVDFVLVDGDAPV